MKRLSAILFLVGLSSVAFAVLPMFTAGRTAKPATVEQEMPSRVWYVSDSATGSENGLTPETATTLTHARDLLRASGRSNWDGAWVVLLDGTYYLSSTFTLEAQDSGTADFPVEYRAASGATVRILGSKPLTGWSVVTSGDSVYDAMPDAGHGNVYKISTDGVVAQGTIGPGVDSQMSMLRLIVNGNVKTMSRWPAGEDSSSSSWKVINSVTNTSRFSTATFTVTTGSIPTGAPNPDGWDFSGQQIMAYGSWESSDTNGNYNITWERINGASVSGSDTTFTANSRLTYFPWRASVSGYIQQYVALRNGIEFISSDTYVWNRNSQILYYWSPSGAPSNTTASNIDDLIQLNAIVGDDYEAYDDETGVSHVIFRGLILGDVRNRVAFGGYNNDIQWIDCEARNFGMIGFDFINSTNIVWSGCTIHHGATRAIRIHGGNWYYASSSGNAIHNTHIYDIGYDLNAEIAAAIETHSWQLLPYQSAGIPSQNFASSLTIDQGTLIERVRDGVASICQNFTFADSTIDTAAMITGDSGGIGNAARFVGSVGLNISRNTFRNVQRMGLVHVTRTVQPLYLDGVTYGVVEDNVFEDCDAAMQVYGKNLSIRRNKFTGCAANHSLAAIVIGERVQAFGSGGWYQTNPESEIAQISSPGPGWGTLPWSTTYAGLYDYRVGGPKNGLIRYHENIVVLDNLMTDLDPLNATPSLRRFLIRVLYMSGATGNDYLGTVSGYQCGIDMTQRNYGLDEGGNPPSGTPVDGGDEDFNDQLVNLNHGS